MRRLKTGLGRDPVCHRGSQRGWALDITGLVSAAYFVIVGFMSLVEPGWQCLGSMQPLGGREKGRRW